MVKVVKIGPAPLGRSMVKRHMLGCNKGMQLNGWCKCPMFAKLNPYGEMK
jgi:hypothetical protein